jgi:hypothetical protein
MNHMMLIARSAGRVCARFTALLLFTLQGLASTLQINSYAQPVDNFAQKVKVRLRHAHVIHMLDRRGTLSSESPSRAHRKPLMRVACGVAVLIVILVSLGVAPADGISNKPYTDLDSLADYQLTNKQYACHSQIVYRESSGRIDARNGSHHGYYQIRNRLLIDSPYDYQFYFYWKYVSHRYGITQYDEPDYCKALHHLRVKGWQ